MKKLTIALLSAVIAFSPMLASAATVLPAGCSIPPDHAVWNADNNKVVSCISGANWQAAIAAQSHGDSLPIFFYPQTITDKYGITYACEAFLTHGCVDATKTPEYDVYIRNFGKMLVASGFIVPVFAQLMTAVR